MADSTDDPLWTIFGVKLKPSAIAENIVASLVIAFAGFMLLDFFTAFSNQLGRIMPRPGSATANVIDFTKIAIAVMFAGAFAYHLNRLGLWTANDAALAALHTRLTAGETAGTWYARTVRSAIFLADRFFGDAGKARESWRPHAFRLKKAAPLWTAASYDKCLLIALVYPLVCIYAVWALSGDFGDAGAALGMVTADHRSRTFSILLIIATIFCVVKWLRTKGWQNWCWLLITSYLCSINASVATIAFAIATICIPLSGIFAAPLTLAVSLMMSIEVNKSYNLSSFILTCVIATVFIAIAICIENLRVSKYCRTRSANLYELFTFLFLLICFLIPVIPGFAPVMAIFYFVLMLTLVNAPFDWFALGITRGLLRKGLEKRGLWPLGLGLADLLFSLFTVAVLGVFVLIFTQIFNASATLGGAGKAVFDPLPALRDLATPGLRNQPQYYWLYLMLLTTQIPAILNLGAGFLSVIRTGDFGNMWVLRLIGDGQGVGLWTRGALAAVQAGQFALGMVAGGLLFYLLFIGFVTVEPFAAGNLIDLLLWIAEANWPARLLGVAG